MSETTAAMSLLQIKSVLQKDTGRIPKCLAIRSRCRETWSLSSCLSGSSKRPASEW